MKNTTKNTTKEPLIIKRDDIIKVQMPEDKTSLGKILDIITFYDDNWGTETNYYIVYLDNNSIVKLKGDSGYFGDPNCEYECLPPEFIETISQNVLIPEIQKELIETRLLV